MSRALHRSLWFIGLVLLQVLVLNNVHIAGYATPFLYIYLLLVLPSTTPRIQLMFWAFGLGLAVDILSDTPGMNAAASTLLAFIRGWLLGPNLQRDTVESITPGVQAMGRIPFLRYAAPAVALHHAALLALEYLSLAHPWALLLRLLLSTALTLVCVMAIESIHARS